jgi:hypothetical protein
MKRVLRGVLALVAALFLGVSSAWLAMSWHMVSSVQNGPWLYDPLVGSEAAGPYLRAQIARAALLALNNSEAIYFVATHDSEGNPLRCDGRYRIEGHDLDARWWSITAYGEDDFLMANEQNRYSYNMTNLSRNPDKSYTVRLSRASQSGNWIPLGEASSFSLWLRLFNPSPGLRKELTTIPLPRIIREDATHG